MKRMKNIKNKEAVSPVIGVILMVVITVIIAAILAVFAFGIGGPNKAPEAQLKFVVTSNETLGTIGNGSIQITNAGGDSLILKDERISATYAADLTKNVINATTMDLITGLIPANAQYLAPGTTIKANVTLNPPPVGAIIIIKVLDVPTGQMVADARVTVQ